MANKFLKFTYEETDGFREEDIAMIEGLAMGDYAKKYKDLNGWTSHQFSQNLLRITRKLGKYNKHRKIIPDASFWAYGNSVIRMNREDYLKVIKALREENK